MPLTESQRFHAWAACQPSTRDRLRAFWSHWFGKDNPHMSDKPKPSVHHGDVDEFTHPNTPPPRTAWSKDPWPDARGSLTPPNAPCRKEATFSDKDLSVLTEAQGLVYGDRQRSYGHPAVDFARTAALVNTLLASKLSKDLGPEDVALFMVAVKLSRECHEPARDNLVDAAGYLECRARVLRFLGGAK